MLRKKHRMHIRRTFSPDALAHAPEKSAVGLRLGELAAPLLEQHLFDDHEGRAEWLGPVIRQHQRSEDDCFAEAHFVAEQPAAQGARLLRERPGKRLQLDGV